LEVFFVNNSGLPLERVELTCPLLYKSSMTEAETLAEKVFYLSVQPNEAVKVAEFDVVFDSDFLHILVLHWKVTGEPDKKEVIIDKGIRKFGYKVLEWLPHAPGE